MINRVFVYNEELAKKNGKNFLVFKIIIFIIMSGLLFFIDIAIGMLALFLVVIYSFYLVADSGMTNAELSAFIIDENNRILKLVLPHVYTGAGAIGQAVGGNVGGLIGNMQDINATKQNMRFMQNPEYILKIIDMKPKNVDIFEISKVYSVKECKSCVKINCDMISLNDNKCFYKFNLRIGKCYIGYEDLIKELKLKKEV